jgi:hypothetical protein
MQEQATNPLENFLNAKFLLKDLTGITMTDEDFIEKAYRGFRKIGNIATATHTFKGEVDNDHKIKLPCNVEFVEALCTGDIFLNMMGDVAYSAETTYGPKVSQYYYPDIFNTAGISKINLSRTQLHPVGQLVPYEICGKNEALIVDKAWAGQHLTVIYRGQILDEDGLPALTAKEVEALAYYVAYLDVQKRIFMKEPGMNDMFAIIKPQYTRAMQAAKIPEYLSQNFWDQLLSANTRMDRKQFGASYKLIR